MPHRFNIFLGISPVTNRIEVTEIQLLFASLGDLCNRASNLASYEGFTAAWRFVVEENSVGGMEAITFAVINGAPIRH